jgi:hypothetical protein
MVNSGTLSERVHEGVKTDATAQVAAAALQKKTENGRLAC